MARTARVAIIGGGIGGLCAALALEQRGIEVQVFEQSAQLGDIGAGLNLSPNALKVFRALGLEERVNEIGYQGDFQLIRTWNSGRLISRVDRKGYAERFGAPHLTVHRADLVEALARSLKRTDIRLGARCIAVESDRPVAVARFADGSAIEADAIVGADGLHSVVRSCLFGPQAPHFTGCICYRGLVRVEDAPRDIATGDSTMWMGPHGHVVHYRVRRGELLNIVAHYDSDAWTEESWTRECDRAEITEHVSRLARRSRAALRPRRALVQMGALRPRSARALEPRQRDAPGRFPRTRCCPISGKARAWRSRTAMCWPRSSPTRRT